MGTLWVGMRCQTVEVCMSIRTTYDGARLKSNASLEISDEGQMAAGAAYVMISTTVTFPSPTPICITRGALLESHCRVVCWSLLGRSVPISQHSTRSSESLNTNAVMREFCWRGSALSTSIVSIQVYNRTMVKSQHGALLMLTRVMKGWTKQTP